MLLDLLASIKKEINIAVVSRRSDDTGISDLYGETLRHIEEENLLDADSAIYNTLQAINERLTTAALRINLSEFSALLDALIGYLNCKRLDENVQTLVRYLPATIVEKNALMLHMEAELMTDGDTPLNIGEDTPLNQQRSLTEFHYDNKITNPSAPTSVRTQSYTQEQQFTTLGGVIPRPLQLAIQSEVEELQKLITDKNTSYDPSILRNEIANHLDNLTFIAESVGADDLIQKLNLERTSLIDSNDKTNIFDNNSLAELLSNLHGLLNKDFFYDSTSSGELGLSSDSGNSSASDAHIFTDERLAMLHEELSYFDDQLDSQAAIITAEESTMETMFVYIHKYSELMERLIKACDALGLQGLKRICNFVIENVNLLPTLQTSDRPQLRPLLQRWPQLVKQYLVDPSDDPTLMELIELMQRRQWPACFDGLDCRDLYVELCVGADSDSGKENETRTFYVTQNDVSLEISAEISPQLRDAYLLESPDVAAQFNQVISSLATCPNPLEAMRAAQRLSHTLKGSANLVGIKGIANLAHHVEDILDILSRKGVTPPAALTGLLQEAADCLEGMLDAVAGVDSAPSESVNVLQRVIDVANRLYNNDFDHLEDLSLPSNGTSSTADDLEPESSVVQTTLNTANPADIIRIPTTTVDAIFRLVEEVTISLAQIQERVNRIKNHSDLLNKHDRNLQLRRFDLENLVDVRSMASMQKRLHRGVRTDNKFDPLELDQYDKLHGATHSYIEAVADTRQISSNIHNELMGIEQLMTRHTRLNKELQHLVSTSRMVPISNISSRLHRTVRQVARATGKAGNLAIEHNNLLMDSDVLNKLIEPLSHILRNAVDHGMPEPAESSESGHITITFDQEGNSIVIRCSDDGKGLDYARIREVAVERGIITAESEPSREELAQIIMSPAFTTRRSATHISGRGIGLDAALTAITELKGSITVGDVKPHGTEFVIRLPLSLVTTHTLVVQAGGVEYAIPTSALSRILPAKRGDIIEADGSYTLHINSDVYPLKSLASLVEGEALPPTHNNPILLAQGTTPTAIAVDVLLHGFELVIKRLGRLAPRVPGVIGVSVLSDGRLVPVLDIPGLLSGISNQTNASSARGNSGRVSARPSAIKRHVLVVDDSLSARNSLAHLLEDGGYSVLSARDGVEAVEILQRERPLVVLADLEMPRMDGIELTRHIRANKEFSELPVVMITSRSQKKHRDVAQAAGVSAYVTKPYGDNELIDLVSSLVSQQ